MSLPQPLLSMCKQWLLIEAYAGDDAYGAPTFSASTSCRCRIANKSQIVVSREGNEVASRTTIWLAEDLQIDPRSRITLPGAAVFSGGSSQPPIINVEHFPDATTSGGLSHAKLYI